MSTQPPVGGIPRLLELGCRLEQEMAGFYQVLAALHQASPTTAALWHKTAQEELQHAAQFRLAMSSGGAMLVDVVVEVGDLLRTIAEIQNLTASFQEAPPEIGRALEVAIDLEERMAEIHLDQAGRFVSGAYRRLFSAMMGADRAHVGSLRDALRAQRGR